MATNSLHINLLQRHRPQHLVAWSIVGVLALTVLLLGLFGNGEWSRYAQATARRDATAAQLKRTQQQLEALSQQQARSASTIALREQVEALKPKASVARALAQALKDTDGDRASSFTRILGAAVGTREAGVWLTAISVAEGGRKIALQGNAASGAAVLQFARRANELLQPMAVRLDTLDMQPLITPEGGAGVAFRLQ